MGLIFTFWRPMLLVVLLLIGTHTLAYYYGGLSVQADWDASEVERKSKAEAAAKLQKAEQDAIVKDLTSKLKEAENRKAEVQVVVKEVTKYVTKQADDKCTFTAGFEWMYNLPLDPGLAGSEPADVDQETSLKASEVAAIAAENNAECVARGQVIEAWQEWYGRSRSAFLKAKDASEAP